LMFLHEVIGNGPVEGVRRFAGRPAQTAVAAMRRVS
jgi:hypothetical protein